MTRLRFTLAILGLAAVAVAASHQLGAQPPASAPPGGVVDPTGIIQSGAGYAAPGMPGQTGPGMMSAGQAEQVSQARVNAALKTYGAAEGDEQRVAAEQELQEAVGSQFEVLMMSREAQVAELKERLDRLTEQLQKRREAKDEIVKLRVEVLIKESQGLGFYPEGTAPRMGMSMMGGSGGSMSMGSSPVRMDGGPAVLPGSLRSR